MQQDLLDSLRLLSDEELVARVERLAGGERGATVLLVAHLAELDTREACCRLGHASLFLYCRDALHLSEQEAYNRIAVARAAKRYPAILEMLEAGSLNLTSVRLLAPHLTLDNHGRVLESARGKTKSQVEEIAAALWPRPDAPSSVRKLPPPRVTTLAPAPAGLTHSRPFEGAPPAASSPDGASPSAAPAYASSPAPACPAGVPIASSRGFGAGSAGDGWRPQAPPRDTASALPPLPPPLARRAALVTPLSPDRYRVQVTIGGETLEKLRLAQDLLRHAVPTGDEAVIFDRALTALLSDLAQRKFAAAHKPRPGGAVTPGSRYIPAEVKRQVWWRDLGRCAFVGSTGRRCSERGFLEYHHVKPHALGGEATLENIELRCRSHNAYEARLYFGLDEAWGMRGSGSSSPKTGTTDRERSGPSGLDGPSSAPDSRSSSAPDSRSSSAPDSRSSSAPDSRSSSAPEAGASGTHDTRASCDPDGRSSGPRSNASADRHGPSPSSSQGLDSGSNDPGDEHGSNSFRNESLARPDPGPDP